MGLDLKRWVEIQMMVKKIRRRVLGLSPSLSLSLWAHRVEKEGAETWMKRQPGSAE
jgi:hypothetical protein